MLHRRDCAALITAAGRSSRMGRPKALLDWGGVPLLTHQSQTLSGFSDVVIVLGHDADILRAVPIAAPTRGVDNPAWERGRSTSFEVGAGALADTAHALLVVAVDQPLDGAVIDALLAALDPDTHTYAVPRFEGRRGHPILIGARLWPELRHAGRYPMGLRDVLAAAQDGRLEVPVNSPSVRWDLNTPEGYRAAIAARDAGHTAGH